MKPSKYHRIKRIKEKTKQGKPGYTKPSQIKPIKEKYKPRPDGEVTNAPLENVLREFRGKKGRVNPYQPPSISNKKKLHPYTLQYDSNKVNDSHGYMKRLQQSGLQPTHPEHGTLNREEYECFTNDQCNSGGQEWPPPGSDSNGVFYEGDVGDCGWGITPIPDQDECEKVCQAHCGGARNTCPFLVGDDGNWYYPDQNQTGDDGYPPNNGCGYWNECGSVPSNPEACEEYTIIWASRYDSDCELNNPFDTRCKCWCQHHRAYLQETDTIPTVSVCMDTQACNPYHSANGAVYPWCEDDQFSDYCNSDPVSCDYSCYGCTDGTAINYDGEATKACNSNYGEGGVTSDCSGYNCCCDYENIRTTANKFRLTNGALQTDLTGYNPDLTNNFTSFNSIFNICCCI